MGLPDKELDQTCAKQLRAEVPEDLGSDAQGGRVLEGHRPHAFEVFPRDPLPRATGARDLEKKMSVGRLERPILVHHGRKQLGRHQVWPTAEAEP